MNGDIGFFFFIDGIIKLMMKMNTHSTMQYNAMYSAILMRMSFLSWFLFITSMAKMYENTPVRKKDKMAINTV
jgi:hypothetical protein